MKKNKMMRLASVLLVLTLLSTSVISGTFAKYTTQDSASDSARVAKWGVELQVVGDLYGRNYKTTENTKTEATTGISVQANADDKNVVAPGTKHDGSGFSFSLNGQPEVTTEVITTVTTQNIFLKGGNTYGVMIKAQPGFVTAENYAALNLEGLYTLSGTTYSPAGPTFDSAETYYTLEDQVSFSDDYYYPVVYALSGATNYTGDCVTNTLDEIAKKIVSAVDSGFTTTDKGSATTTYSATHVYEPNTFLADVVKLGNETLTWEWKFDNDGCNEKGDAAGNFCKADTILGMLEHTTGTNNVVKLSGSDYIPLEEYTDYCLETSFSIDITVTQVD